MFERLLGRGQGQPKPNCPPSAGLLWMMVPIEASENIFRLCRLPSTQRDVCGVFGASLPPLFDVNGATL